MVLEENAGPSEGSNAREQHAQDPRKQGATNQRLKQNCHINRKINQPYPKRRMDQNGKKQRAKGKLNII